MVTNILVDRFGDIVDFGSSLIGPNLNLVVIRGYAPLDALRPLSLLPTFTTKSRTRKVHSGT